MAMVEVGCSYCGNRFKVAGYRIARTKNFYCNFACKGKATKQETVKANCAYCGNEKIVPAYEFAARKTVYCNLDCKRKGQAGGYVSCLGCGSSVYREKSKLNRKFALCPECKDGGYGANPRTIEVKCEYCDKSMEQKYSNFLRNKHQFCDKECYNAWRRYMAGNPNPQEGKMRVPCRLCGKEVLRNASQVYGMKNQYCSQQCYFNRNGEGEKVKTTAPCAYCGKMFALYKDKLARFQAVYCSKKCMGAHRKDEKSEFNKAIKERWQDPEFRARCIKSGSRNPFWKGGKKTGYYGDNWGEQRRATRIRDGHTCQVCGVTRESLGRNLDVHHIKPFRDFGYVVEKNDNYIQANRLENLITLCKGCHKKAENGAIYIQPKLL